MKGLSPDPINVLQHFCVSGLHVTPAPPFTSLSRQEFNEAGPSLQLSIVFWHANGSPLGNTQQNGLSPSQSLESVPASSTSTIVHPMTSGGLMPCIKSVRHEIVFYSY